ncbi:hypothetical protein COX85_02220 [Candidatus Micrarchaeota archaeon CG_4_10_14_0_2_um_filter_55_9]|nr:MAG: hypothetical protein COT57_03020 [Candidatus Micrarchaeota archaeon CG09_land_8_20_14_0_10_55_25]PIZ91744.1 MAG: hypothetical protein COX85_02220 [Candidatus Micrarchaeota archaeon CG_4_10_14_0_2_um_filter_55_9]PJD01482.1 MAG: hypothetical protein COU38_00940 [Candidatus Micrarchaeota archaeon CG10_big_fil_rev_8_21_14_0_10_54_18]
MKQFTSKELLEELREVGESLSTRVTAYLIGGCSMSLRGLKDSTKDVDLVFADKQELNAFSEALEARGYEKYLEVNGEYEQLGTEVIYRKKGAAGFDLFLKTVCRALRLSKGMRKRAKLLGETGKLAVFLCSEEDVFLFKSITERPQDVDDMAALLESKREEFDWEAFKKEVEEQSRDYPNLSILASNKLSELKEKHELKAPIESWLIKEGEKTILQDAFNQRLEQGMTREQALNELKKRGFSQKELSKIK